MQISFLHNPVDVAANRERKITPQQMERLKPPGLLRAGCLSIVLMVFGTCAVLFLAAMLDTSLEVFVGMWFVFLLLFGAVWGWVFFRAIRRKVVFQRECQEGAISQGRGELVFHKNEYQIQVENFFMALPPSENACGLLPGTAYQVYYLSESHQLLSIEEPGPVPFLPVQEGMNKLLQRFHKFGLDELDANNQGQITPGQRLKLLPRAVGGAFLCLGILMALLVDLATGLTLSSTIFPLIVAALGFYYGWVAFANALSDLLVQAPMEISGRIQKKLKVVRNGRYQTAEHFYVTENQSLQVSYTAYQVLLPDLTYRIFYLPKTRTILSMEMIAGSTQP